MQEKIKQAKQGKTTDVRLQGISYNTEFSVICLWGFKNKKSYLKSNLPQKYFMKFSMHDTVAFL